MLKAVLPEYAAGMKSAAILLKVLALCSTVALGGGYVWWSQKKAEDKRVKEEAHHRTMLSGSKSKVMVEDAPSDDGKLPPADPGTNADFIAPDPEPKKERTMLPGSKIGLVSPPQQDGNDEAEKERTILPGSKSAAIGDVDRQFIEGLLKEREEKTQTEETEKKRTVLPGSKSLDRILPPPDIEKKSEP